MRSSLHAVLRPFLALGLAGLLSTATRDAAACWDGWYAEVGGVGITRGLGVAEWNPEHAREAARWGARINALLPPGAALAIEWDEATCASDQGACGAVTTIAAGSEDLPATFRAVAKAFHVPAAKVRKARALDPELYTVQIFAGSKRRALAVKDHVAALDAGDHGFFVEGGFPAPKQTAHVLRDPEADGPHRVIVGTFLSRKEARAALAGLRAKGFGGYVRALPAGKAIQEESFTKMG
ncbi:SPOR domain-containing protein [Polyangium mundeleinium]|uniref:SPOR domain-containing protein n=1 Tax=Polyangium mundeleinium TaxID=2995306 RepID=A0ABT5ETA9_9BACT|nr:SPOR domain-containing protein [Polyangium mundeleinium]MDC0744562.1 SPOR domain-containing protein [Polyangium mundeleinium]